MWSQNYENVFKIEDLVSWRKKSCFKMVSGFPAVAVAVAGGLEEEDKSCPEEKPQEEEQQL